MTHRRSSRLTLPALASAAAALTLLAAPTAAQTVPFAEGELLVRVWESSLQRLYRIDPFTGQGTLVVGDLYPAGNQADSMAFDPYRERVLIYTGWQPTGLFAPRLFALDADGAVTDMGYAGADLAGLTPVGDGRVYLFRNEALHMLDAGDNLVPVTDGLGQPVDQYAGHLQYDAATNSLIGTNSFTPPCGPGNIVILRYPLDASGTQLAGPIECSPIPTDLTPADYAVGLDALPSGNILVTTTGGQGTEFPLLSVNPATLGASVFAPSTLVDNDGGVWCAPLNRAVVLNDTANELRTFAAFQAGAGTPLVADVPVGDGSVGFSEANQLSEVELGSACAGFSQTFGVGLAGTGGFVPSLTASLCPTVGAPVRLRLEDGRGQATALIGIAGATAPYPLFGGTGYLVPPLFLQLSVLLDGFAGIAGDGTAEVAVPTPNVPSLIGVSIFGQAAVVDPGAPQGFALSAAVEIGLG